MARKDISDKIVVQACFHSRRSNGAYDAISYLLGHTDEVEKVCYAAMARACGRDLIDYGVSIRMAWPTDKGLLLLKDDPRYQNQGSDSNDQN